MSRYIASLIFISIIIYLFWIDRKNNDGFSKILWIPFVWLFYSKSGRIFQWAGIPIGGIDDLTEGNALARTIYSVLVLAGFWGLSKRNVRWREWFLKNPSIWLYFLFGTISILWSDYSFVSFKRLIKASGNLIMALVIMTETKPYYALGLILKRLSFILLPLSVLFIKYYPELGRAFARDGTVMYVGVSTQKNQLGALCMIFGIYYIWNVFYGRKDKQEKSHQLHYSIYIIMLPMIIWLLNLADSATSLACLIIAVIILLIGMLPIFIHTPRKMITYTMLSMAIFGITETLFNIKDTIIIMLGRRPDLTTRVPMWEDLLSMVKNPIIGFGYESFWIGERLINIQSRWGPLKQAHNGYIEMYLNMGVLGVFFILWWIIAGLKNISTDINEDYSAGILRFCFVLIVILYNYTEASLYGVNTVWMLLFIGIMTLPDQIPTITCQRDSGATKE